MEVMRKADTLFIDVQNRWNRFLSEERGDTNFISMLVILGIALALAGVFLGFKDQVLDWVNRNIGDFFNTNVGSSGGGVR